MDYKNVELLHADDFGDFDQWYHEAAGEIARAPDGGMRLHCIGSQQGGPGCMAFFRPTLPDHIAIEYDIIVRSHGGLVINYIAMRGLNGEDLIEDRDKLPPRTGVMRDYWSAKQGLQSYHISFSRFDDDGSHADTANARRNPGLLMMAQSYDPCMELDRKYRIRVVKSRGHLQFNVDGRFCFDVIDRDASQYPIPDTGKFGFRLIGSDVKADVAAFSVHRVELNESVWQVKV
jgi:hypothetical protein